MFDSGRFSDFEVHCDSRVWKLHKVILYDRSPYFKAMFECDFVVSAIPTRRHNRN
jgi:hypothetical protein